MTWQRTRTHHFGLAADRVWSIVGDLSRWAEWSRAISSIRLDGPTEPGVTGAYVPAARWAAALHTRTATPLRVVSVDEPRHLVIEQPNPTGTMRVEWTVRATGDASCTVTQRVRVTGLLTPAVVLGAAGPMDKDWQEACVRLHGLLRSRPSPLLLKVVIAGGSGSLGRAIAADLSCRGHEVVLLTRRVNPALPYHQVEWDGRAQGAWVAELSEPDRTAVVNLAGRLVDVRPTPDNIAALRDSRVQPTRALVEASEGLTAPLAHWLQGSTTAIWSDAGETRVTESTPLPTGSAALPQMTGVAEPWEAAVTGARTAHLVILRTSIVLQTGSPAFDRLSSLTRYGLGGRVGSGRQWFSWIHIDDWLRIVRASLGLDPETRVPSGVVIGAAPHPVRNEALMSGLRKHLHRPIAPPSHEALVALGGVVLRTDPALGLTGRHCTSDVLDRLGFEFDHPTLDGALTDLLE